MPPHDAEVVDDDEVLRKVELEETTTELEPAEDGGSEMGEV